MPLVTGVQTCALPIYSIELKDQVGDITNAWILQQEADCRLGVQRNGDQSNFDLNSSFCQEILGRIPRLDAPGTPNDQQVEEIVRGPTNRAFRQFDGIEATFSYRLTTDRSGTFVTQLSDYHLTEKSVVTAKRVSVQVATTGSR